MKQISTLILSAILILMPLKSTSDEVIFQEPLLTAIQAKEKIDNFLSTKSIQVTNDDLLGFSYQYLTGTWHVQFLKNVNSDEWIYILMDDKYPNKVEFGKQL